MAGTNMADDDKLTQIYVRLVTYRNLKNEIESELEGMKTIESYAHMLQNDKMCKVRNREQLTEDLLKYKKLITELEEKYFFDNVNASNT